MDKSIRVEIYKTIYMLVQKFIKIIQFDLKIITF